MRILVVGFSIMLIMTILIMTNVYSSSNRIVAVYFYPWYSSSSNRHWNNVIDKPYIGYYDSYNETVIKWQLELIKDAGIDIIIFSWWGPYSFEDNTTKTIVKYLREYSLEFVIMVEPYLGSDPECYNKTFWENVLSYVRANYIDQYSDIYFHLNGKPLILAFNPIGMKYNPSSDFPGYAIRITGNDIDNAGYQDWDYWPDYINPSNVELKVRRDGYVAIIPRYDDTHFHSPGTCIDTNYTDKIYIKQWQWILKHKDKISIVAITSWNEYHERTMIEPHYTTADVDPFYIYEITRKYVSEYKRINTLNMYAEYWSYMLGWSIVFLLLALCFKFLKIIK